MVLPRKNSDNWKTVTRPTLPPDASCNADREHHNKISTTNQTTTIIIMNFALATTSFVKTVASSDSIPLPKSHIHLTPSDLQLADDMLRAEYYDDQMFMRLFVGMESQILREYSDNGVVHPLTLKSWIGLVKTKQANDEDLMRMHDHQRTHRNHSAVKEMMTSSSSQRGAGYQASMDTSTKSILHESSGNDQDDEDCIFNLEF
jgi:hypothetical protein